MCEHGLTLDDETLATLIVQLGDQDGVTGINALYDAMQMLGPMGSQARMRLWELARQPGRNREHALVILAACGEWPLLEPPERAVLQQWVDDRVVSEIAEARMANEYGECSFSSWLAVSTGDQDALVDVLGLHQPMPVTMRMVRTLVQVVKNYVYLTPELDGWTLICYYHHVFDAEALVVELSRRFGAAQYFCDDYGYKAWALAEGGELLRLYSCDDDQEPRKVIGPPHPAEILATADLPKCDESDDRPRCSAQGVAAYASLDPAQIGPETQVRGHGLLASALPAFDTVGF